MRHKTEKEVRKHIGRSESIEEIQCPKCGGILVTNYGLTRKSRAYE